MPSPHFPEFLEPSLRDGPLPAAIAEVLARPDHSRLPGRAALAELFWTRDLLPWEKKAALRVAALGGPLIAGDFICCGASQHGHLRPLSALREATRASNLSGYLSNALKQPQADRARYPTDKTAWGRARFGLLALAAIAFNPLSCNRGDSRFFALLICGVLLALPSAGFAAGAFFGLPLAAAALAAPVLGGLSVWGFASLGRDLQGTSSGEGPLLAFGLLAQARLSGALSRLRSSFKKAPALASLRHLDRFQDDWGYAELSPEIQRRISAQDYELSKNPLSLEATLSFGEALDLEDAIKDPTSSTRLSAPKRAEPSALFPEPQEDPLINIAPSPSKRPRL